MSEFASAPYTMGQLNAIVKLLKKQGGEAGPDRFLRGELTLSEVVRPWREEDGVIRFSVTSDGTTGAGWIKRREQAGYNVGAQAKGVLLSSDFRPTSGVTTEIVVMKGSLFSNNDRYTANIREEASKWRFVAPNPEVACLIRIMFTDEEIGAMGLLGIVTMHEPVKVSDSGLSLLSTVGGVGRWLDVCRGNPARRWSEKHGFAFAALASD